jgi:hypothetical protein
MFRDTPSARRTILVLAVAAVALTPEAAATADCPGRPHALGTFRAMTVDPREFPRLGTMQYAGSLPLADKEVVLTFDDGPMPPYSNRVLDILAQHCVKAHYFLIGRMARGYPAIVRRIQAEGHTVGTHSQNHVLAFDRMPLPAVQREIEQGIASVAAALGKRDAVAPFFASPACCGRRRWRATSPRADLRPGAPTSRATTGSTSRQARWCAASWRGSPTRAKASSCCTTSSRRPRWRCRNCCVR